MNYRDIYENERKSYNELVSHPLQSYEWGEFREKTGVKVIRKGKEQNGKLTAALTLTFHKIPKTNLTIGYLPKGSFPTKELLEELKIIGRENNCVFIQLEPNVISDEKSKNKLNNLGLHLSHHPLFTKFTFTLDLTKSEEELRANMHQKTRYNIRVAEKRGVTVKENSTDEAFNKYLELTDDTTTRQKFYAHTHAYHRTQWEILPHTKNENMLSSHLLTAQFEKEVLAAWILFIFNDILYYPYGASSSTHRDKMASNLIMWEAIQFGKKMGCTSFDMWGALGKNPDTTDPWYGFHRFKENYGAVHTEFIGSYDYVLNPSLYKIYKGLDMLRWGMLRLKKRFV
jgi:lipid II:glycine glycyltransferase (peptidoglycan interpeptide bridge formation enzyme)